LLKRIEDLVLPRCGAELAFQTLDAVGRPSTLVILLKAFD